MNIVELANTYRDNNGHREGVVLVFEGKVYGWKNELRNPEHEQPGAIAIDKDGNQWIARGGDSYNGADRWEQIQDVS